MSTRVYIQKTTRSAKQRAPMSACLFCLCVSTRQGRLRPRGQCTPSRSRRKRSERRSDDAWAGTGSSGSRACRTGAKGLQSRCADRRRSDLLQAAQPAGERRGACCTGATPVRARGRRAQEGMKWAKIVRSKGQMDGRCAERAPWGCRPSGHGVAWVRHVREGDDMGCAAWQRSPRGKGMKWAKIVHHGGGARPGTGRKRPKSAAVYGRRPRVTRLLSYAAHTA